jgi:hypothetical protein
MIDRRSIIKTLRASVTTGLNASLKPEDCRALLSIINSAESTSPGARTIVRRHVHKILDELEENLNRTARDITSEFANIMGMKK